MTTKKQNRRRATYGGGAAGAKGLAIRLRTLGGQRQADAREEFEREVDTFPTGRESEPLELLYFKVCKISGYRTEPLRWLVSC